MHDIMKASFYSYRKSKQVFYSVFTALLLGLAMGFAAYVQNGEIEASVIGSIDNWMFNTFLIIIIFTASCIGSDFKNKTIYYEVMSGHKTSEIIIGRMIPTLLFTLLIMSLAFIGTYSFGLIWGGWGEILGSFKVILIRYLLLMWNSLPFVGFCILSIYGTKNIVTAIVLDWGMFIFIQIPLLLQSIGQTNHTLSNIWMHTNMRSIISGPLTYNFCFSIMILSAVKFILIIVLTIWIFERSDLK